MEEHSDHACPCEARGLNASDVIDFLSDLTLVDRGNSIAHFRRAHTRVIPNDRNDWDIYLRENVERHARSGSG